MKEVTVRVTKQLEKDVADLERCASQCSDARDKKTLERVSKNLRKHLAIGQSGGMAPIDPATLNIGDLLNTSGSPIDAGANGSALLNIHAPFYEGGLMGAGQLFAPGTQTFYLPEPTAPTATAPQSGGKSRRRRQTKNRK